MGRSYKKQPIVKDSSKGMKTIANRRVRRLFKRGCTVANGNAYRKLVCSYDISDWLFRETWLEYQERAERYRKEFENGVFRWGYRQVTDISAEMNYWQWYKMYKRK